MIAHFKKHIQVRLYFVSSFWAADFLHTKFYWTLKLQYYYCIWSSGFLCVWKWAHGWHITFFTFISKNLTGKDKIYFFFELMRYVSTSLPVKSLCHFSFKHLLVKLCGFFFFFHSMLLVYFRPWQIEHFYFFLSDILCLMLLLLHQHKGWINDFTRKTGTSIYKVLTGITGLYSAIDNYKRKCPKETW